MQITINNITIPIASGTNLPLVLRSPLFDDSDGKTPGSFIFNVNLPATKEIRSVFEQAHRPIRNGRATASLPYVIQMGTMRFSGTCTLKEASQNTYEVVFNINNGDIAYKIANKTLKDLDLGGDRPISITKCAAHDLVGFRESEYADVSFYNTKLLSFHLIDLDVSSSFNSDASKFTFVENDTVLMTMNYNLFPILGTSYRILVKKNDVTIETFVITEDDTESALEITGIVGDEITIYMRVQSEVNHSRYEIDYELTDLYIEYQSTSTMEENNEYAVFPIENKQFFTNFPDDAFQIDNLSIKTIYSEYFYCHNYYTNRFPVCLKGVVEGETIFAANLFTPFVFIKTILDSIAEYFGYSIQDSPFETGQPYYNAVLFNAYAENTYPVDDATMVGVKPTFNLTDHVPEIAIGTFLNSLGKLTGRRIDVDNQMNTIKFIRLRSVIESVANIDFPGVITTAPVVSVDPQYSGYKIELKSSKDNYIAERVKTVNAKHVYKGSVTDLYLLPTTGNSSNDMYLVTKLNEFYVWKYSSELYKLAWVYHSKNFYLTKQDGDEPYLQISADMAPVLDHVTLDETIGAPANRFWLIPITQQSGNYEGYPDMSSEYGLQILFYKGMHLDSLGNNYPLATSGKKNYSGSETFTNPNLCIDGLEPNIFTEDLKQWIDWIVDYAKPVAFKAILTPAQLRQINYATKYRVLGATYLIKEIKVNIVNDHLSEAEIEAYTC